MSNAKLGHHWGGLQILNHHAIWICTFYMYICTYINYIIYMYTVYIWSYLYLACKAHSWHHFGMKMNSHKKHVEYRYRHQNTFFPRMQWKQSDFSCSHQLLNLLVSETTTPPKKTKTNPLSLIDESPPWIPMEIQHHTAIKKPRLLGIFARQNHVK